MLEGIVGGESVNRKDAIRDLARLSQEMGVYDEFIEMGAEEEPNQVPFEDRRSATANQEKPKGESE